MLRSSHGKRKKDKGEDADGEIFKGSYCTACYTFVKRESLIDHLSICTRVGRGLRMEMPDKKETFKFKDHAATDMTPFICLFDFESFLPNSSRKNGICDHNPASGFYII